MSGMQPTAQGEPIAIVGMGCRLPGEVSSPSQLWQMLLDRRSGHCSIPESRFRAEAFYHPDADRPGSINSTTGYFIREDLHAFENAFFGINNREASSMDPQQRKLLEVAYEALESAGVPFETMFGSNTGVFVANFTVDYMTMQYKDPEFFTRYSATGSDPTILANRVTHCFDLRGPSSVVDTACSSSLYSLHAACSALDAHECDGALVASANLIQSPELQLVAVKAGILSPDGMCHTFDAAANGYGRAEAVSSLYLKRLSDALRDGDPVRCVIRGTAVNGNGKTPGIMQPSIQGQAAVIRKAYARAGLPTNQTDYIEAHGTGTIVGDPFEVEAIASVLQHDDGRPIYVGGVKPSLGHSEGASGISSILKVALALENKTIPATIGVSTVNPNIRLDDWNIAIATETCSWPASQLPRASINSFGFGGSNGHVILEAADLHVHKVRQLSAVQRLPAGSQRRKILLPLTAKTRHSLAQMGGNLANYISQRQDNVDFRDLCHTLANRRSMLPTRGYFLANADSGKVTLADRSFVSLNNLSTKKLPLAFIYTGQGAQWAQMGRQLFEDFPRFRRTLQQLDSHLASLGSVAPSWTLESVLLMPPETSTINAAEVSQPVCTAVQIALTDLLSDWNLHSDMVLGHSSGEIAAAYTTGALSQRQAIVTAYLRGLAVADCRQQGAMLAVGLDQESAQQMIADTHCQQTIKVACINSPENVTLSGDKQAVDQLHNVLKAQGIFVRKLNTNDKAYHSHHMEAIGPSYQRMLETHWQNLSENPQKHHGSARPRMVSTVTGTELDSCQYLDPSYWRINLESTVQFGRAVTKLFEIGRHMIIEIGPHGAMKLPVKQTASRSGISKDEYGYHSTMVRNKDSTLTILSLAGTLFLNGYNICLDRVNCVDKTSQPKVLHDLPPYPWDYETGSLWTEPRSVREFRTRRYPRHDLLGSEVHHGNPSRTSWRNVLNPEEITWLQDHRLGPTMVFPAAAYMAMAVEAMCQVSGLEVAVCPGVEIREFFLLKALKFGDENKRVEIFTEFVPDSVTVASISKSWRRFRVYSVTATQCTEHVSGLVRLLPDSSRPRRKLHFPATQLQHQATRTWYAKFTSEGLNWGPHFAVMEDIYCDRDRRRQISSAATKNVASTPDAARQSQYLVHPINIDGMLQTAFVATTGGRVRDLRATVPVSIGYAYIMPQTDSPASAESRYIVDAESRRVGFGTVNIDAELRSSSGDLLVTMGDVRCIAYAGNVQSAPTDDRNLLVRVAWKPDIKAMGPGHSDGLARYLEWFASATQDSLPQRKRTRYLAGALDLVAHWRSELRILELGADTAFTAAALEVLRAGSPLRRMNSYVQATITAEKGLVGRELCGAAGEEEDSPLPDAIFDVILLPSNSGSPQAWPAALSRHMSTSTVIIMDGSSTAPLAGTHACLADGIQLSLSTSPEYSVQPRGKLNQPIVLIHSGSPTKLDDTLVQLLNGIAASPITYMAFSELSPETMPPKCVVVATVEARNALLRDLTECQMARLQLLTNHAAKIVWVTNCDIMQGKRPDFAVVQGLARALMLEQPSTVFSVFDVDDSYDDVETTADNIEYVLLQLLDGHNPDFEYAQAGGLLHSLRFMPEDHLNASFRARVNADTKEIPAKDAGRCKLSLAHPGQLDTLHFVSDEFDLDLDSVEIKVQSVGINAKDLYALAARVDTKDATCSCECSGVVTRVGASVKDFEPGDRVVAMAPGHFATVERFPEWACLKLLEDEDFTSSSTIPLVYATTLYAFCHRAKLEANESVLIHSAAGGVGIAAIQLAQDIGAKIFATVGTQAKKDFLVQHFGLNPSHIFNSRNASFLPGLMAVTSGRGVDVVLNSLTGELLHESLNACADFGRFVEIGKRDILDHGRLDMTIFARNISFMAFDLHGLYSLERRHQVLWQSLLAQSMQLFRSGRVKHVVQPKVFDASKIKEAFRYFSSASRTGKVAVSFENVDSVLKVIPERYDTRLNPRKAYFMVGCLGGLGRSISKWMASRGARNFVFLGRSGTDKPEAQALVEDLERSGAAVTVIRGDVSSFSDVRGALSKASAPIGGVIQAAMGLDEALWTAMSCKSWHTAIDPKVRGTWNIHNALLEVQTDDVDFFVMTSSISGSVGTATESNYCSGNAFLDSFARYRTSLGLRAVSLGLGMISEVGYLHEHPDIEKLMKRKGIHAINEDELLHILDLALSNQPQTKTKQSHYYDSFVTSHLLTGVEFIGLKDQRDRGFEGDNHVLADPRASLLAAAFARSTERHGDCTTHDQLLPEGIKKALRAGSSASVLDATRQIVAAKISNLILLPLEKLDPTQYLSEFGMDSMLAAEFRMYIFQALEVDVPFMTLLGDSTSIESLVELIVGELAGRVVVRDQK